MGLGRSFLVSTILRTIEDLPSKVVQKDCGELLALSSTNSIGDAV